MRTKDIAHITNIPEKKLLDISQTTDKMYHSFPLPKGNGAKRWIEAPTLKLKRLQKSILENILYKKFAVSDAAHGFVPNRSIVTNAQPHVGQKWVLNVDIKSFFTSTHTKLVRNALSTVITDKEALDCLVGIMMRENRLPQGAPTSPCIANLAMLGFDNSIKTYAALHSLKYTRYADDITLSGDSIPKDAVHTIKQELSRLGYRLAPHKTKFMGKHRRQSVTGLVVNKKVNLPIETRRLLRAIMHDAGKNGIDVALKKGNRTLDSVLGYLSFLNMCDPALAATHLAAIKGIA